MFYDSTTDLHNIFRIPVQLTFGFSDGWRKVLKLFPSDVKILFCMDKIASIEWQDLVPRQRIGGCLLIHVPH